MFRVIFKNTNGELRNGWWIALFFLLLAPGLADWRHFWARGQRPGFSHGDAADLKRFKQVPRVDRTNIHFQQFGA